MKVAILGAGAMGSALTVPLVDRGHEVRLWGTKYDVKILDVIAKGGLHPRIGVKIPDLVKIYYPEDLKKALKDIDVVILGVSSAGVASVSEQIKDIIDRKTPIVIVAKGLEEVGGEILTMTQIVERIIEGGDRIIYISGPSIAKELAHRYATMVVYNSKNLKLVENIKKEFETTYYKISINDDVIGAELCASLKNIYAIAIGWFDGFAKKRNGLEMNNAKSAFFAQAIKEMAYIVEQMGGKRETVYGLSGIGDLLVTTRGGRNGMFGMFIGMGFPVDKALKEMEERGVGVVEGYVTAEMMYKFINGKVDKSRLPLFYSAYEVLFKGLQVLDAVEKVLNTLSKLSTF
ncbi:MAG: glycerol-3-phosphate dehydrogenase [Thermoprotei archaeon]|nr:MAG: glycerol-3-phosphate dehydrogenase [Thermoprotei archaeon]